MNSNDLSLPFRWLNWLGLLVALFIVYGSLVPFEYRAAPLDQGIAQFIHIKWLNIQVGGRADWVANLVLYLPFGFFVCGALSKRSLLLAMLVTGILGAVLAAGVEFLQIWAEPRTVSLNDIVAEIAGTFVGIFVWSLFGRRLVRMTQRVLAGGPLALRAAIILYILAYCLIALFPFDFLVSRAELHARLADPQAIVWLPHGLFTMRGAIGFFLKVALMLPLGAVLRLVWQRSWTTAALAALILSSALETLHWFEYSEQTDALSIAAAVFGAVAGNSFAAVLNRRVRASTSWLPLAAMLATPFYLVLLLIVRGWKLGHVSRQQIEQTLASTHWLPFYYHYYTSEANAVASLLSIAVAMAPLGGLAWAVRLHANVPVGQARSLAPVAIVAFSLSLFLEVGGLITAGHRPDPTNVLISVGAAIFAQRMCEWLARILSEIPAPVVIER